MDTSGNEKTAQELHTDKKTLWNKRQSTQRAIEIYTFNAPHTQNAHVQIVLSAIIQIARWIDEKQRQEDGGAKEMANENVNEKRKEKKCNKSKKKSRTHTAFDARYTKQDNRL